MAQVNGGRVDPGHRGYLLAFQYLLFACLGLCCSYLWNIQFTQSGSTRFPSQDLYTISHTETLPLAYARGILNNTDCEALKEKVHVPENVRYFLGTKLRYQFEEVITDGTLIGPNGQCNATRVSF